MKNNFFKLSLLVFALFVAMVGCKPEEEDPITYEDGIYLVGTVTPFDSIVTAGLFDAAINEVNQTARTGLYELYVPIKAGTTGFQIVIVEGGTPKYYGPGTDFTVITNPTQDEPKYDFQRGSLAETTTVFTVPADGMYQVGFDKELMKVVVVPVHWGIIGGATPGGWGGDTLLVESAFNETAMSWELTNLILREGDFKFRHSHGWKVELDTTLVIDAANSKIGVKLNTNFGGTVAALVAGGNNIVNSVPGFYTVTIDWTLADGYTATVTKTGDLDETDWTGVILDAVGAGIDPANTNAVDDESSWNWGYRIVADNSGLPTISGVVYTWTWNNVSLLANEGFKLRTENGIAPANGNGANFDAGKEAIDYANSSVNVEPYDGLPTSSKDIKMTVAGTYDITITIDASQSDKKTITIKDNVK